MADLAGVTRPAVSRAQDKESLPVNSPTFCLLCYVLIFTHLSRDDLLNRSNVGLSIRASVCPRSQYFQNPKTARPLSRGRRNSACSFCVSGSTTSRKRNFKLHELNPVWMIHPDQVLIRDEFWLLNIFIHQTTGT